MYFPSKRDLWLGVFIWPLLIIGLIGVISSKSSIPIVLFVIINFFTGWIWLQTGYTLTKDTLKIQCGPFRSTILYEDIIEIYESRNPLSSPALSLDRLCIRNRRTGRVYISPRDKERFTSLLKDKCLNLI